MIVLFQDLLYIIILLFIIYTFDNVDASQTAVNFFHKISEQSVANQSLDTEMYSITAVHNVVSSALKSSWGDT